MSARLSSGFIALFSLCGSLTAFAFGGPGGSGREIGNGGSGVECQSGGDDAVHLLEVYEGMHGGPMPRLDGHSLSRALGRLRADPAFQAQAEILVKSLRSGFEILDGSTPLAVADDLGAFPKLPPTCEFVQLANYGPDGQLRLDPLFNGLPDDERPILFLHEAVYKIARDRGAQDSSGSRKLVEYLLSAKTEAGQVRELIARIADPSSSVKILSAPEFPGVRIIEQPNFAGRPFLEASTAEMFRDGGVSDRSDPVCMHYFGEEAHAVFSSSRKIYSEASLAQADPAGLQPPLLRYEDASSTIPAGVFSAVGCATGGAPSSGPVVLRDFGGIPFLAETDGEVERSEHGRIADRATAICQLHGASLRAERFLIGPAPGGDTVNVSVDGSRESPALEGAHWVFREIDCRPRLTAPGHGSESQPGISDALGALLTGNVLF